MEEGPQDVETVWVPVYLPLGVGSDSNLGRELADLILTLTVQLAPAFGIELASDLAHFCVTELDADDGLRLFTRLARLSRSDVSMARSRIN